MGQWFAAAAVFILSVAILWASAVFSPKYDDVSPVATSTVEATTSTETVSTSTGTSSVSSSDPTPVPSSSASQTLEVSETPAPAPTKVPVSVTQPTPEREPTPTLRPSPVPEPEPDESDGTFVRTIGQREGSFLIQAVLQSSVEGLWFEKYPVARSEGVPRTLHVGDDIGYACEGSSVELIWIDSVRGRATFRKVTSESPFGGCPL